MIKEDNPMMGSRQSLPTQTRAQSYREIPPSHHSFTVTEPANLPVVKDCKNPGSDSLGARALTAREIEIIELLGTGLSVKGSARELAISPGTVKWHVKNIFYKLGASSCEDALLKARLRKII